MHPRIQGYGGAVNASLTVVRTRGRSDVAHDILAELPEWFGAAEYTCEYVEAANSYVNYVAARPTAPGGEDPHDVLSLVGVAQAFGMAGGGPPPVFSPAATLGASIGAALGAPAASRLRGVLASPADLVTLPAPQGQAAGRFAAGGLVEARTPSDGERALRTRDALGIALLRERFHESAEVHLLAVRRAYHRTGIGRALLAEVEADLRARGVRLLSVKTLGPSRPDPQAFDRTRAFYRACGFLPVEEFPDLWPDDPCLLMVKVL